MTSDIYGEVLLDYHTNRFEPPLLLHNDYGAPEEMPVAVFFRDEEDLPDLERYALSLCCGRVLDVGAGAGVHSLILQKKRMDVLAIENSAGACQVMEKRGVSRIVQQNVFNYRPSTKFDTILMLMNGTGLAGTYNNFKKSLLKLKPFLAPSGQIIIDSSDISYLYNHQFPSDKYFGEVAYQYEYKGRLGNWFSWLYLDQNSLLCLAREAGFKPQIIYQGGDDDYLAILESDSF